MDTTRTLKWRRWRRHEYVAREVRGSTIVRFDVFRRADGDWAVFRSEFGRHGAFTTDQDSRPTRAEAQRVAETWATR